MAGKTNNPLEAIMSIKSKQRKRFRFTASNEIPEDTANANMLTVEWCEDYVPSLELTVWSEGSSYSVSKVYFAPDRLIEIGRALIDLGEDALLSLRQKETRKRLLPKKKR